jgi:pyruvate dehydrogenase E1 component
VAKLLSKHEGPVVAASDYVQMFANQIRPFIDRRFVVLGTDGYGRSDTRKNLRRFFEVDRHYVAVAALAALADEGAVARSKVSEAIKKYGVDADKPNPLTV